MSRQRVYFATGMGMVKIGCSVDVEKRLLTVTEWIPFPVSLVASMPGSYALEATIQRMFAEEWSHGEWFHASPRLMAFIKDVQLGRPVKIVQRELTEEQNRRAKAIADKKRIARKRDLIPADILAEIDAVRPCVAIPDELLARAWASIATPNTEAA